MSASRLKVEELTRFFGPTCAVNNASFAVNAGQVLCLLGPSGCGKSTMLRLIAGVDTPNRGEIFIDGKNVQSPEMALPPEHRSVGLLFQDFALFPHLTIAQNVAFGLPARSSHTPIRVADLLSKVDMDGRANAYPHELSGGEQQRVALARALAPAPKVMLLDEPFSGLDHRLRDEIRDTCLKLLREAGTAVVLVTHEPDEAMRMGDEIALMRKGQIVQSGAPYNLYNAPCDLAAAAFFSELNIVEGIVHNALVDTPFGEFLVPGQTEGAKVKIAIRPQHLRVDFDRKGAGPRPTAPDGVPARAIVIEARFMGRESIVKFRTETGNVHLKATVPGVFLPKPGVPLFLSLRRDRCFIFPAT